MKGVKYWVVRGEYRFKEQRSFFKFERRQSSIKEKIRKLIYLSARKFLASLQPRLGAWNTVRRFGNWVTGFDRQFAFGVQTMFRSCSTTFGQASQVIFVLVRSYSLFLLVLFALACSSCSWPNRAVVYAGSGRSHAVQMNSPPVPLPAKCKAHLV